MRHFCCSDRGRYASEARRRLTLGWWNACRALGEKSSIRLLTRYSSERTRQTRGFEHDFHRFHSRCPCGTKHFLTTDHNFTDCRHALRARDHDSSRGGILHPTKAGFIALSPHFSFTDRIVTGAGTSRRRGTQLENWVPFSMPNQPVILTNRTLTDYGFLGIGAARVLIFRPTSASQRYRFLTGERFHIRTAAVRNDGAVLSSVSAELSRRQLPSGGWAALRSSAQASLEPACLAAARDRIRRFRRGATSLKTFFFVCKIRMEAGPLFGGMIRMVLG